MKKVTAIRVKGISKTFRLPQENHNSIKGILTNPSRYLATRKKTVNQKVLDNISFTVDAGDFFGILGRNGSGKSTLLKVLAAIYKAESGTIQVSGRLLPFIELGVGFNGELTGRDNVYLSGALFGYSDQEIDSRYAEIVAFAELEQFMDQKLKNYSSGMHVRLAFSIITILSEGDILLLDEVLAVGDASFQQKCFDYFRELKRSKKTVVLVTHNMSIVKQYCNKAILIDDHKIVCSGSANRVAKMYSEIVT